jgi:hypothetical protein
MHAVGADRLGEVRPVVDDEGDVARVRERQQPFGGALHRIVGRVLQAKLQCGDVAGIEGAGERIGEGGRLEGRRRDQVEAAGAQDYSPPL